MGFGSPSVLGPEMEDLRGRLFQGVRVRKVSVHHEASRCPFSWWSWWERAETVLKIADFMPREIKLGVILGAKTVSISSSSLPSTPQISVLSSLFTETALPKMTNDLPEA